MSFSSFTSVAAAQLPAGPLHLAIGMFDGVHLGHRAVLSAAVTAAKRENGLAAALTFSPHPSALFNPSKPTRLITDTATKARIFSELGLAAMITEPFTAEFAHLAAEEFLPWLKQKLPTLVAVYVGENWRFGRGRRGDVTLLRESGKKLGVAVFSAPRVSLDGEAISSTRIRTLLENGEIAAANRLLGYAYFSEGVVAPGKKLGRTIGFPTLNLAWSPELRPRLGVYVVRVTGDKSPKPLRGVANYGLRPTVEASTEPKLETHLLEECPFDAGDRIRVEWLHFLRPEMKFNGLDELRRQIAADRAAAADMA